MSNKFVEQLNSNETYHDVGLHIHVSIYNTVVVSGSLCAIKCEHITYCYGGTSN